MALIMVTTDNRTVVFVKHHSEYPADDGHGAAKLLNDLAAAVLRAETHIDELREKQREIMAQP